MLTVLISRVRRTADGDSGLSLIELTVTLVMSSIVGACALTLFLGVNRVSGATTSTSQLTAAARSTMLSWSNYLQLAGPKSSGSTIGPVNSISPTSIDFWAYLNTSPCTTDTSCPALTPSEITLSLINGKLGTALNGAAPTYGSLAGGSANAGGCLFTAYTQTGSLGCGSTLTAAQLSSITSVGIAFGVTSQDGQHTSNFSTQSTFTYGTVPVGS